MHDDSLVVHVCGHCHGLLFEALFLKEVCNPRPLISGDSGEHLDRDNEKL